MPSRFSPIARPGRASSASLRTRNSCITLNPAETSPAAAEVPMIHGAQAPNCSGHTHQATPAITMPSTIEPIRHSSRLRA